MAQSKIFLKNRALGYVSNHIPLQTRYIHRRKDNLIVTCVGKSFHTYSCSHFTLLTVSGVHPGDITCMAADTYHIYTASECDVFAWRRGTELRHTYKGHKSSVHLILPFAAHLISIDEDSNLILWDIKTEELILELNFSNEAFKVTTIVHPNTYINKILLGSEQGNLQLWNINTSKLIYTFNGWNSSVTALEQAPAIDVVAIGLANGVIKLHNLKLDTTLFELVQDWGSVTSISFRTDDQPIMATGSMGGHIVLWNLEQRKVESQILRAHFGAVAGLKCLPNEPLLVSNSPDNSLKLWIFDLAEGAARLLRIREGHSEPPTFIKFYGNTEGQSILTAGSDSSMRIFSTVSEIANRNLGRASYNRKASKRRGRLVADPYIMPAITSFAMETTREKEWDNIAAIHLGLNIVTTWSYDKQRMGEHKLVFESLKSNYNAHATCAFITNCGNFVLIGYNTGHVCKFNIQSGIFRGSYGDDDGAHGSSVTGIFVDTLNQVVVTAGHEGTIKFWPFKPKENSKPAAMIELSEGVKWVVNHKESSLIAFALEDFGIILVDTDTKRIVRRFTGHDGHLTDATFSPDARWLITASIDCTIRTWDIPSGQLVDVFQVEEACTSIDFSPTGEFLATIHVSNLGIYLWTNRTLFSHVTLKPIKDDFSIPVVTLPGSSSEQNENIDVVQVDNEEDDEKEDKYVSPDQLADDLITLSLLPNSRWQNLLNIDIVKKRNKPKEAPKAPEAAPFFLPTIPSLDLKFDLSNKEEDNEGSKLLIHPGFSNLTTFGKLLIESDDNDFSSVINKFKQFSPSSIDFEIQSLTLDLSNSEELLLKFMKMIKFMMDSKKDFELSESYLGLFIKTHGSVIKDNKNLLKYLDQLIDIQSKTWTTLRQKLFYNLSLIQHFKKM